MQVAIPSSSECGVNAAIDGSTGSGSLPVLSPVSSQDDDSTLPALPVSEGAAAAACVHAAASTPLDAAAGLCSASQHPDVQDAGPPAATACPDAPMDGSWLATCVMERRLERCAVGRGGMVAQEGLGCRQLHGPPAAVEGQL